MAGYKGNYWQKAALDEALGATNFAPPATVYICLLTDSNTALQRSNGTYTEVTNANAYARVAVTNNATNWPASSGNPASKSNGVQFNFPTCTTATWGTVTAFMITDSATNSAGNILYTGDLSISKAINVGDQPYFAIGTLTVTEQ